MQLGGQDAASCQSRCHETENTRCFPLKYKTLAFRSLKAQQDFLTSHFTGLRNFFCGSKLIGENLLQFRRLKLCKRCTGKGL